MKGVKRAGGLAVWFLFVVGWGWGLGDGDLPAVFGDREAEKRPVVRECTGSGMRCLVFSGLSENKREQSGAYIRGEDIHDSRSREAGTWVKPRD